MALFEKTSQAPQLGFAPSTTPANSFTPPDVPVGYGQMQGQPPLSRNPNYGVPSGLASLLGGANPMGAPQAGAFLAPQQAVGLGGSSPATPPMLGTNPFTGQAFQTFDPTEAENIFTQGRIAEEQAAAQAFAQAEADRVAAEQAAAEAEAARTPYDDPALEQLRADVIAQGPESYGTKLYEDLLNAFDTSNRTDQIVAQNNAALEQAREAEASSLALAEAQAEAAAAKEQLSGFFNPPQETTPEPEPAIPAMSPVPDVMPPMQIGTFGPRDGLAASPLMPGSFDPESGTFLPSIPVAASVPAPLPEPPLIERPPVAPSRQDVMRPPLPPPPPPPPAPVTPPLEPETSLGDRLRGMGGIFANAVAPGDVGYEALAAAAEPTGPRGFVASQRDFDGRYPFSSAQQPAAQESIQRPAPTPYVIGKLLGGSRGSGSTPAMPVGIDALLGEGGGEPANIPMPAPRQPLPLPPPPVVATPVLRQPLPLPPVTTPDKTRAAATPKPFVAPDLSALLPVKPRTQKVTKPKKGRKVVPQPDQRSSRKKRRRKQRGPR